MSKTLRSVSFAAACALFLAGYVAIRRVEPGRAAAQPPGADARPAVTHPGPQPSDATRAQTPSFERLRSSPHVLYRSARSGEFGHIVIAQLDAPETSRLATPLRCERAHFDRNGGICLTFDRDALEPNFRALLVDGSLTTKHSSTISGYPSRTSLSPDGIYAAATVFTTGDSYDSDFSTRTTLFERATGAVLPDLEQFTVRRDGHVFKRVDFNFWGVTFTPDGRTFYATMSTGGTTYLVRGDVATKSLSIVREGVECPSLSPNGRFIAFKKRDPKTATTRLHTLDTQSWQESPVHGETRHIDDQAAWLDDAHVLYGVTTSGAPEEALNVWVASIAVDGTAPRVFLRGASSPSVVR